MLFKQKKSDKTKALLICETEEDKKVLWHLYHCSIIFGLYSIWLEEGDRGKQMPEIKEMLQAFPNAKGIGWLSIPESHLPKEEFKLQL